MRLLFSNKKFTDKEIIHAIQTGSPAENMCLRYLYDKQYLPILKYVLNNQGTETDAQDIFHDALAAFYEQVKNGRFKGASAIGTYLYAIGRNLWLNKLKKSGHGRTYEQVKVAEGAVEKDVHEVVTRTEKEKVVLSVLEMLGEDCRKILVYAVYEKLNMEEIAELMGFKNAQNARNKKAKCNKKLKDLVKERADVRHLLEEIRY